MNRIKFLLTGTHAYGPITPNSDLDIVIMREDVVDIMDFLNHHGIDMYQTEAQEDYNDGGFYFDLGFIKINIIIAMNDVEFISWSYKTDAMKKIPVIRDREERLKKFNSINLLEDAKKWREQQ